MTHTNLKNQKVDDELRCEMARYKFGIFLRLRVHDRVNAAIDTFCQDTCVWDRGVSMKYRHNTACGSSYWLYPDVAGTNCPHCGKRIVEKFELIGEKK